jgi:hypothetical protein
MQKVVGSNPISRFTRKPALERAFVVQIPQTGNQTTPDMHRLAAISADAASLSPHGGATVSPPT